MPTSHHAARPHAHRIDGTETYLETRQVAEATVLAGAAFSWSCRSEWFGYARPDKVQRLLSAAVWDAHDEIVGSMS
jgi:hypothetical protein